MTKVIITTNKGKMVAELNDQLAPKSVENFLSYMNAGHYSNTIFHRVIDGFMIQGGGFEPGMKQKPCLLYTSPSPRDRQKSRMPSSA